MKTGFLALVLFGVVLTGSYVSGCPIGGVHIAFSAYMDSSAVYGIDQIVIFNKVHTNDGGNYCNDTGTFTAPIPGTYFFTWTLASVHTVDVVSGIAVNGHYKAQTAMSGSGFKMGSNSVILKLTEGDKVWIAIQHGSSIFSNTEKKWYYPTFSGYLLYV